MEEHYSIASAAFTTAIPLLTATPSSPIASNPPATVSRSKPFSISPNKRALLSLSPLERGLERGRLFVFGVSHEDGRPGSCLTKRKPNLAQPLSPAAPADHLPTFPDPLFPQLPHFLKEVVSVATAKEERDILLLGALGAISSCFPHLYGIYDGKKVHANLFLFITAKASAGKGRLVHCRQLVAPVHKRMREQARLLKQQYDLELAAYNKSKGQETGADKPARPPEKMLFIPANSSSTGVFQLLFENEGRGLIFETEGDTLAQIFKSDYGNYSDGFRKAFHHETISYYRRTDMNMLTLKPPAFRPSSQARPGRLPPLFPMPKMACSAALYFIL